MTREKLQSLHEALQADDFVAELVLAGEEDSPLDQLLAFLGNDAKERPQVMQFVFLSDLEPVLKEQGMEVTEDDDDPLDFLQLYVTLPFEVKKKNIPALALRILEINNQLPLLGFGLSETGEEVYFRHMMLCYDNKVDPRPVIDAADLVAQLLEVHSPELEELANCA